jgi:REP element-mobilizing transposase RayT
MYLRQPAIAQLVVESIRKGEQLGHYELYAFAVMANHVHILVHPLVDPSRLLKSLGTRPSRIRAHQSIH